MGERSISIVIANRTYPVSVKDGEEKKVHAAARKITDMLREFEVNYSVRDKQDLLAMCALQLATQLENTTPLDPAVLSEHVQQLSRMEELIDNA